MFRTFPRKVFGFIACATHHIDQDIGDIVEKSFVTIIHQVQECFDRVMQNFIIDKE